MTRRLRILRLGWLAALSLTSCDHGLSVPYNELYVPCETDDDCPREASECHTHRFYLAPSRTAVEEFRQCSRPCNPYRDCASGTLSDDEGGRFIVVRGMCVPVDEAGVFDETLDSDRGYCLDVGNVGVEPSLPLCPTLGTAPTEVFGGFAYGTPCLPTIPPVMSTPDAGP